MKTIITEITDFIEATNIITNFGGWCVNFPAPAGKDFPYGLKPIDLVSCSNMYTYDDNHLCSGYAYVSSSVSSTRSGASKNELQTTLSINIFTNIKKNGELLPTLDRPIALLGQLIQEFKQHEIKLTTPINNRFQEFAQINITFLDYAPCTFTKNPTALC